MAIAGVAQPETIVIDISLRLRRYDGNYGVAVPWYQDEVVYTGSEGITDKTEIPDADYVRRMYSWFEKNGKSELYFIEVMENGLFIPIGDAAVQEENPPIVIGVPQYRGVGIGKKVLETMVRRARELGFSRLYNVKIFHDNIASQRLYTSCGFRQTGEDARYKLFALAL